MNYDFTNWQNILLAALYHLNQERRANILIWSGPAIQVMLIFDMSSERYIVIAATRLICPPIIPDNAHHYSPHKLFASNPSSQSSQSMSFRSFVILQLWLSSELHFQINSRNAISEWIGFKSNKIIQFQFLLKGPFTSLQLEPDTALYDTSFHSQIHFISNQSQWIQDKSGKLISEQETELRFVMKCEMNWTRPEWESDQEINKRKKQLNCWKAF